MVKDESPKLECKVQSIEVEANWEDQGHGNKKGEIFLSLMRDGNEVAIMNIFGVYQRDDTQRSKTIDESEDIVKLA